MTTIAVAPLVYLNIDVYLTAGPLSERSAEIPQMILLRTNGLVFDSSQ